MVTEIREIRVPPKEESAEFQQMVQILKRHSAMIIAKGNEKKVSYQERMQRD